MDKKVTLVFLHVFTLESKYVVDRFLVLVGFVCPFSRFKDLWELTVLWSHKSPLDRDEPVSFRVQVGDLLSTTVSGSCLMVFRV